MIKEKEMWNVYKVGEDKARIHILFMKYILRPKEFDKFLTSQPFKFITREIVSCKRQWKQAKSVSMVSFFKYGLGKYSENA